MFLIVFYYLFIYFNIIQCEHARLRRHIENQPYPLSDSFLENNSTTTAAPQNVTLPVSTTSDISTKLNETSKTSSLADKNKTTPDELVAMNMLDSAVQLLQNEAFKAGQQSEKLLSTKT